MGGESAVPCRPSHPAATCRASAAVETREHFDSLSDGGCLPNRRTSAARSRGQSHPAQRPARRRAAGLWLRGRLRWCGDGRRACRAGCPMAQRLVRAEKTRPPPIAAENQRAPGVGRVARPPRCRPTPACSGRKYALAAMVGATGQAEPASVTVLTFGSECIHLCAADASPSSRSDTRQPGRRPQHEPPAPGHRPADSPCTTHLWHYPPIGKPRIRPGPRTGTTLRPAAPLQRATGSRHPGEPYPSRGAPTVRRGVGSSIIRPDNESLHSARPERSRRPCCPA